MAMTRFTLKLPDTDSCHGVSLALLVREAERRGTTAERMVNVILASYFGFEPPEDNDERAWRLLAEAQGWPKPSREVAAENLRRMVQEREVDGDEDVASGDGKGKPE
jgi:hypothetical protein